MAFGEDLPFLVQIKEEGYEVPELDDQPGLDFGQRWYFNAFFQLSRSRQFGFNGPQPISTADIEAFLNTKGITQKKRRTRFMEYITEMDQVFLENEYDEDGD